MEDLPADRPMKYLVDIERLMNDNGGIKDETALNELLVFMKKANKMVPRCILLLIINATSKKLQQKFCLSDGWNLLSKWLKEAKEETNDSLIREILTVMAKLPVSVTILKSNSCAKVVKQLAKSNPEVSQIVPKLAREVVIKWMAIINETFEVKEKDASKEKTHSKKHRSDSNTNDEPPQKKRKKDKDRKRHESTESDSHHSKKEKRLSTDSKEHVHSSSKHSEKQLERHSFEKQSERHSDKHTDRHSEKQPEKHANRKREREESPDTKQRKRATVKILPQRMRTAGIEEGGEKSFMTKSRSEVLAAKKEKLEKPSNDNSSAPSIESMHQKIKVSVSGNGEAQESRPGPPPSPKIRRPSHEIHESNSFMNALNAASGPPVVRKKKKVSSNSNGSNKSKADSVSPSKTEKTERVEKDIQEPHGEDDARSEGSNDGQGGPKKSSLAEIGSLITKKSSKKSVTWADEDNLREVYYFELDETERVNVNRVISMEEMKRKEHLLERQNISRSLATGNQSGAGIDAPNSPFEKGWYRPMGLEGMSCTVEYGKNSREVAIQAERERHVLAALYFSKVDIPPCAAEPDTAHEDYLEPVIIPLEDQTIVDSDITGDSLNQDEKAAAEDASSVGGSSPSSGGAQSSKVLISENETFCLTPEVASLLKSLTAGLTDVKKPSDEKVNEKELAKSPDSDSSGQTSTAPHSTKQTLQQSQHQPKYSDEVWRVIRENYPHLNLDEPISVERMRQLLEPIQEQLRACGALNTHGGVGSSPPFQGPNSYPNGPMRAGGWDRPNRPMHPEQYGPGGNRPPHHMQGPPFQQRHRHPRHNHPHQQRPHYQGYNQGRGYGHGGPRMPPHRPPHYGNNGPPPYYGPEGRDGGNGSYRGNICRFFQNGTCRSGSNCRFVHQTGGGPHSP